MRLRLPLVSLGFISFLILGGLTFITHIRPAKAPGEVVVIILAWTVVVASIEKAGGLDYLIEIATKLIKNYPLYLSWLGPIVSYMVVLLSGVYMLHTAILRTIIEVAQERKIEKTKLTVILTTSIIVAFSAQIISPVSIVMTLILNTLSPHTVGVIDIIKVLLPATIGGALLSILAASQLQKLAPLNPDSYLYDVCSDKEVPPHCSIPYAGPKKTTAKISLFLLILSSIVIIGLNIFIPKILLQPQALTFNVATIIFVLTTLSASALIVLLGRVKPDQIASQMAFQKGTLLLLNLMGIKWLFNTLFYYDTGHISELVKQSSYEIFEVIICVLYTTCFFTRDQITTINTSSNRLRVSESIT